MHYLEFPGSEPAVLCVHGYCQSSAYWEPTLARLREAGVHGVAPDLPGFADSAAEPGPYTMEALADALLTLIDEKRLERIVLIGGSMGGVVAQHFVLRHPQRVARLLLVATGGATADSAGALAKADALANQPWNEETVRPIVRGFFREPPSEDVRQRLERIALKTSQMAAVEAARSNATSRPFDRLSEIRVPTLIIQGAHDKARTPEHGAAMRDRIAGARLEVLAESGHTPHLEQPEEFYRVALPFLLEGR